MTLQNRGMTNSYVAGRRVSKRKYDDALKAALLTIWHAANQICSKRLVPFIPELLNVLERFGHISLPTDIRRKLLEVSPATVDRLLETTRKESKCGISTTRPGSLLKKQIRVRTFADWDELVPGFFEGDLVAHCGDRTDGAFLNTLVLTDIASSWTEFFPLIRKGAEEVISQLGVMKQILPFPLLGLDTDNGSEFINYALLDFCKNHKITFTRSRAYKKNDQAHVEEKNGSIVRRLIGYDRFEGIDAYNALSQLYATLRLYVNFFQPSLKLISKKRDGAQITKKYDKAKTPYQRILLSSSISDEIKEALKGEYEQLDPVVLLQDLQILQDNFLQHVHKEQAQHQTQDVMADVVSIKSTGNSTLIGTYQDISGIATEKILATKKLAIGDTKYSTSEAIKNKVDTQVKSGHRASKNFQPDMSKKLFKMSIKTRKKQSPRTWRTRIDPFEGVSCKIRLQLEINPTRTAKSLLEDLVKESPDKFNMSHLRTMQRNVLAWRKEQIKINQERFAKNAISNGDHAINKYIALVANSVSSR
jgi:hypothetical protein